MLKIMIIALGLGLLSWLPNLSLTSEGPGDQAHAEDEGAVTCAISFNSSNYSVSGANGRPNTVIWTVTGSVPMDIFLGGTDNGEAIELIDTDEVTNHTFSYTLQAGDEGFHTRFAQTLIPNLSPPSFCITNTVALFVGP